MKHVMLILHIYTITFKKYEKNPTEHRVKIKKKEQYFY